MINRIILLAMALLLAGCAPLAERAADAPTLRQTEVAGARLHSLEAGRGATVIFLHGGAADHRIWQMQRAAVAAQYRFIALDQRYFGNAPWVDDGAQFALATHVADLAAFIRARGLGPVILVGQSYGSVVALATALQHPQLVRGLFLSEPPLPALVSDAAGRATMDAERKTLAPVAAAVNAGDAATAVRQFVDWVNGQPGAFEALPAEQRAMHLDNARTLPLQLKASANATLDCAQLGQLTLPLVLTRGSASRPFFRLAAERVQACVPGARLLEMPQARHVAPQQAAAAFNAALLAFLAERRP